MSRVRVSPTEWRDEGAQPARIHTHNYSVPAEVVGNMRPVLSHGGNTLEAHTGYRQRALSVAGKPR